ncbi:peptidylprolyl isomerase [Erysipelothrix urinaevulpis]|uniref:peptidylprolyl isomerase n=1 Tax=Erysipelothrix urinaevulpis TaxID=2683717 RepID=UPI0013577F54|nr:peptidylprolyl isomerase [Erysipelothrix urinaevulpis]
MIDNLKKHWFVVIVAIIFLIGIIYFANTQINSVLKGKRVDGKDVVSEVNNVNLFADDYYDKLLEKYGDQELYKLFERASLNAIPSSDEDKKKAEEDAKKQIQAISAQQGAPGLENLDKALVALGYSGKDELAVFYENMTKKDNMTAEYLEANYDKYVKKFIEDKQPRMVSHILITMDDSSKPTDAEQQKINKVDEALKGGKNFGEVALEFSDDQQTAPNKGSLGYMDKETEYQEEFLASALSLKQGETGVWIKTSYGQHLVHIDSTDYKDFKTEQGFLSAINNANPELEALVLWSKAKELDIKFHNKDIEKRLKTIMGIEDDKQ